MIDHSQNSALLRCEHLSKTYKSGNDKLVVLEDLNLSVPVNEFLVITGESGSGKSTLLHLLGNLDHPTTGEVYFHDTSFTKLRQRDQDKLRNREFGFVFQFHHLLPEFNALENVALPGMMLDGYSSSLWQRSEQILKDLGLKERAHHKPSQLSGGEQQRVAVARAMINNPAILFMDEPTGNLDPHTSEELINLILQQKREKNLTIIMVTHNLDIAHRADRHLILAERTLTPA